MNVQNLTQSNLLFKCDVMFRLFFVSCTALLCYFAANGQQNSYVGVAKYTIKPIDSKILEIEAKRNPRIEMVLEQLTLSLQFMDSLSAFCLDEHPNISEQDMKDATLFTKVSTGDYYWQDKHAAYHVTNSTMFLEGDYILVDSFENGWHTGWEVTAESKEIAGYKCFKATRDDLDKDVNGNERRFPVVAWFCPELPFSF